MSLAKRIIPCLDVDNGRVVKGVKFVDIRDAGDPVENARRYNLEGADEITFLNITGFRDFPLEDMPMLEVLQHDDDIDPGPALALLGIELTPLDDTLRRYVGPESETQ